MINLDPKRLIILNVKGLATPLKGTDYPIG